MTDEEIVKEASKDEDTPETPPESPSEPRKRKVGRPRKGEIAAKKKGNRGVRGRPPGDAAIINEYKARMLASPKSAKVLEKIFDAALDDNHKHQAAAWKLLADRIVPISHFEKDKEGNRSSGIKIEIKGIGVEVKQDEVLDAEFTEVEEVEVTDDL